MRYVLGIIVLIASLGAIGVTITMNASYQYAQGATPSEALLRASAMGVFDCVKAGLPVGVVWWVSQRRWLVSVLGAVTFICCFAMSLISAIGFYATNHIAVRQDREGVTISYRDARKELAQSEQRLVELGTARPVTVVEAVLQSLRTDKRFASSKDCSDATLPTSRDFCRDYFVSVSELAAAREVERLQTRRDQLKSSIDQLLKAGAERDADPQVTLLSQLLPFLKLQDVKLGVDLLPSLLLEIVAGFGLLLATSMMQRSRRKAPDDGDTNLAPPGNGRKGSKDKQKPMTFKVRKDGSYVIDAS